MFIKEVRKRNKGYEKEFVQHRLMESYRESRGPRQRTVLHLGKLELDRDKWKLLADRVEQKLSGRENLIIPLEPEVECLASHYALLVKQQRLESVESKLRVVEKEGEFESVDLSTLATSEVRTVGAEYVGLGCYEELRIDNLLKDLGLSEEQRRLCAASIIGRLVNPGSEKRTREWLQNLSGLGELLGTDFRHLSNNALYRTSDILLNNKVKLEKEISLREAELFSLEEHLVLYDLSNTYFEGRACAQPKAKHGRSKEKRTDCPLLTLGLVLDGGGFAKRSEVLEGNVSEPKTLKGMLLKLDAHSFGSEKKRTVVMDAGIATEENLRMLTDLGYDYLCVSRSRPRETPGGDSGFSVIKESGGNTLEGKLIRDGEESFLYCRSTLRRAKEQAIKKHAQERFESSLAQISSSLSKKGGVKSYDKVLERLGRAKEKFSSVSRFYQIKVSKDDKVAKAIEWTRDDEKLEKRFSGEYIIRTSRNDLGEKDIWSVYIMLNTVEAAFRSLKYELNLRPVFHRKQERSDAHLFIAVLAYHLLHAIQTKLRSKGIHSEWRMIRERLASHVRVTTEMTNQQGKRIAIRNCSVPEAFHLSIYHALGLPAQPRATKRTQL